MKCWFWMGLSCIVGLAIGPEAHAWGDVGHRAVAEIGERHLSKVAREQISRFAGGVALAEFASWPDSVKRDPEWAHTSRYHYTNVDDRSDYLRTLARLPQNERMYGDIVRGLLKAEDVLVDDRVGANEKRVALAFLIHFVGNIHQPLHSGRKADRGGNDVKVNWFGTPGSLHGVWDIGLVSVGYRDELDGLSVEEQGRKYAQLIDRNVEPGKVREWQGSYFDTWIAESAAYRSRVYTGFSENDRYLRKHLKAADHRTLQAGYRLAGVLNRLFSPYPKLPPGGTEFRRLIDQVLGPGHERAIVLKPKKVYK